MHRHSDVLLKLKLKNDVIFKYCIRQMSCLLKCITMVSNDLQGTIRNNHQCKEFQR